MKEMTGDSPLGQCDEWVDDDFEEDDEGEE